MPAKRRYYSQYAMDRRTTQRGDDRDHDERVWAAERARLAAEEAAKAADDSSTKDQAASKGEQAAEKGGAA